MTELRAAALARLDVFVGEWAVEARFRDEVPITQPAPGEDPQLRIRFEWALERQFLMQRTETPFPEAPDSLSIVSVNAETGAYTQHYFDSRGVVRTYRMTLRDDVWTLLRDRPDFSPLEFAQRYTGTFGGDGRTITGRWETSHDGGATWEHDFDLNYRRTH